MGQKRTDTVSKPKWDLPYRPRAKDNETDFCVRAGAIWEETRLRETWKKSRKEEGGLPSPPFDSARGYFKRQAYGLLTHYKRHAADRLMIRKLVIKYAFQPESPTFRQNFFHWGLIAVYLVEGVKGRKQVDATMRAVYRMGREMLYAHRNDVKPENLIGFIFQSACSERIGLLVKEGRPDPSLTFTLASPG